MTIPLKQYWHLLSTYLLHAKGRFLWLAILLIINTLIQLINPQIVRAYIDATQAGEGLRTLLLAGGAFIGFGTLSQLLQVLTRYVAQDVAWRATNHLRGDMLEHCLTLDMGFHNQHTPGELIERIDGDVLALSNFFSQFSLFIVGNLLLLVGVVVMLLREDVLLGSLAALFTIAAVGLLYRLRHATIRHWQASRDASGQLYGFLEERLASLEELQANGAAGFTLHRFNEALSQHNLRGYQARISTEWLLSGMASVLAAGSVAGFVFAVWRFQSGLFSLGTIYLVTAYSALIMQPIRRLIWQMSDLQRAGASIVRVTEFLAFSTKIVEPDAPQTPQTQKAAQLRFESVAFGYDPAHPVLHAIDFALKPGQLLGIVGRTGSGKSTISRLLYRLYDVDHGRILLDGVDIRQWPLSALRQKIGLVSQDVELFHASVRDNLTFFDETIGDDTLLAALDELGMGEWVRGLPAGLNTPLNGSSGLSAGEAQLLALTRVFLQKPALIILDEASARLDPITEQKIERAVDRLLSNRTGIIIAHRLQTVERVDQIAVFSDGHLVEYGRRSELAAQPTSHYATLLRIGLTGLEGEVADERQ